MRHLLVLNGLASALSVAVLTALAAPAHADTMPDSWLAEIVQSFLPSDLLAELTLPVTDLFAGIVEIPSIAEPLLLIPLVVGSLMVVRGFLGEPILTEQEGLSYLLPYGLFVLAFIVCFCLNDASLASVLADSWMKIDACLASPVSCAPTFAPAGL